MAFYDDMADVATELLTEFGRTITMERKTATFNPVTGKNTATTLATFSPVGVEVPINDRLIDGTRVKVGDRFIVIDASSGYVPDMADRLQDSPFVGAAIAMEPGAWFPASIPSNADSADNQTVTDIATVGSSGLYTASGRSVSRYDITGWDGHTRAFEFVVNEITTQFIGADLVELIVTGGTYPIRIRFNQNAGTWRIECNTVYGSTPAGVAGVPIGFYVHAQSGDVTIVHAAGHVDKNAFAPLGGALHGATQIGIDVRAFSVAGAGGTNAGDSFSASIISDRTKFERTYPATVRDWDGVLLTDAVLSESSAIVAIDPIKPAGTPVAYRLQVRK